MAYIDRRPSIIMLTHVHINKPPTDLYLHTYPIEVACSKTTMTSPQIPKTMQAWRKSFPSSSPFLKEIPVPMPKEDEVLVKLLAMGVCHSDCTLLEMPESMYGMKDEYTLGHEACGEIVALGSSETDYATGDKVAIHIIPGCNATTCPDCSRGLNRICRKEGGGNYGLGISDGFFAEYVVVKHRAVAKIPDGLGVEEAAVSADAVLTAYHAVRYTGAPDANDTIVILGLGGVGMNGLQTALYLGVPANKILVMDKRQVSLDGAVNLGIPKEHIFLAGDDGTTSLQQYVTEKGIHVDIVFDFAGHEQTMTTAQMVVRNGGTIVLVGLMSPKVPLIPIVAVVKALTVKTAYNGTMDAFRECLELMSKGVLKPRVETGSIMSLPSVLKDLNDGKIQNRMVLLPNWRG